MDGRSGEEKKRRSLSGFLASATKSIRSSGHSLGLMCDSTGPSRVGRKQKMYVIVKKVRDNVFETGTASDEVFGTNEHPFRWRPRLAWLLHWWSTHLGIYSMVSLRGGKAPQVCSFHKASQSHSQVNCGDLVAPSRTLGASHRSRGRQSGT